MNGKGAGSLGRGRAEVKIREMQPDSITFDLQNTDLSVANALRRVMLAEVPTLAIGLVEVEVNNTVLNDEFIVHRMGLIPFNSSRVDEFKAWYELTDEDDDDLADDPLIGLNFELCKFCDSDETVNVTSNDLRLVTSGEGPFEGGSESLNPADFADVVPIAYNPEARDTEGIVIVKLSKGQGLKVTAQLSKGMGKDHAKWNPCATASFRVPPIIHLNHQMLNTLTLEQKQELIASCPARLGDKRGKVFRLNPETREIEVENAELYNYDNEVVFKAETMDLHGAIIITEKPEHFIFTVESTGCLPPKRIVSMGLRTLAAKLGEVAKHVGQLEISQQAEKGFDTGNPMRDGR